MFQNHLLVADHIDSLLEAAANERLGRTPTTTKRKASLPAAGLVSTAFAALKAAWSLLTGPADRPVFATGTGKPSTILPTLTDYPYRG
ncbi:MAG: hypothetical protein QOF49_321 [Chloroflexota bacterium]|nr:hypothetical protein [Chloroflexota bacterium]